MCGEGPGSDPGVDSHINSLSFGVRLTMMGRAEHVLTQTARRPHILWVESLENGQQGIGSKLLLPSVVLGSELPVHGHRSTGHTRALFAASRDLCIYRKATREVKHGMPVPGRQSAIGSATITPSGCSGV